MKRIRYIRPTSQRREVDQRAATDHLKPFSIDIVDGVDDSTFADALKQLKAGNALVMESLSTLGRRRDTVCARLTCVFDKGAYVQTADQNALFKPKDQAGLIAGIMARGISTAEPKPRVAHNRVADADRKRALKYWKDHKLAPRDVERLSGYTMQSLRRWFADEYPRPAARRGRPREA